MKRFVLSLLSALMLLSLFAGCAPKKLTGLYEFKLKPDSLEERGVEVPFARNGVLGIPERENAPVVFILHGTHPVQDAEKDDYYAGFSYLAERLAEAGFLAIGINTNIIFHTEPIEGDALTRLRAVFDSYYAALADANAGKNLFGVDLKDKADLSKINFVGHSRGGSSSLYLSKYLQSKGTDVTSMLLVAPAIFFPMEESYVDIHTGVIVSQYDGDVSTMDGFQIYNYAAAHGDRQSELAGALLYGGNHNRFNSKLDEDTLTKYENAQYISAESQQNFLANYAADFLSIYNFGLGSLMENMGEAFGERYAVELSTTLFSPSHRLLANSDTPAETSGGFTAESVAFSQQAEKNTAGGINIPTVWEQELPLYSLSWDTPGGAVKFDTVGESGSSLLLTLALDPTRCKSAELLITVTDSGGQQFTKTIGTGDTPALRYPGGELQEGLNIWSAYSPLSTVVLDVSMLGEISSVELSGVSESGAVMLQSIRTASN